MVVALQVTVDGTRLEFRMSRSQVYLPASSTHTTATVASKITDEYEVGGSWVFGLPRVYLPASITQKTATVASKVTDECKVGESRVFGLLQVCLRASHVQAAVAVACRGMGN